MNYQTIVIALAALLALCAVAALLVRARARLSTIPVRSRAILTSAELAFYQRLVQALDRIGGVDVFPQVCMSAIIETLPGLDSRERMAVRSTFNRKYVDFTVVDASARPLLLIELDDHTHDSASDRKRDAITAAAGLPTLRIRGRAARDAQEIERLVRQYLPS